MPRDDGYGGQHEQDRRKNERASGLGITQAQQILCQRHRRHLRDDVDAEHPPAQRVADPGVDPAFEGDINQRQGEARDEAKCSPGKRRHDKRVRDDDRAGDEDAGHDRAHMTQPADHEVPGKRRGGIAGVVPRHEQANGPVGKRFQAGAHADEIGLQAVGRLHESDGQDHRPDGKKRRAQCGPLKGKPLRVVAVLRNRREGGKNVQDPRRQEERGALAA